jgi:hypothetical protein
LPRPGSTWNTLAAQLQDRRRQSFSKSWNELMDVIASKTEALKDGGVTNCYDIKRSNH